MNKDQYIPTECLNEIRHGFRDIVEAINFLLEKSEPSNKEKIGRDEVFIF